MILELFGLLLIFVVGVSPLVIAIAYCYADWLGDREPTRELFSEFWHKYIRVFNRRYFNIIIIPFLFSFIFIGSFVS